VSWTDGVEVSALARVNAPLLQLHPVVPAIAYFVPSARPPLLPVVVVPLLAYASFPQDAANPQPPFSANPPSGLGGSGSLLLVLLLHGRCSRCSW